MEGTSLSPIDGRHSNKHWSVISHLRLLFLSSSAYLVLPYFSESPYFDATSNNATIMTQATHNPALFYLIQTREAFEARLRTMQGLEFMVVHDPSENGTKLDHSGVWVIRRQLRRKRAGTEDEVTPISSYYVVGENIYMASSLGNVLGARLVRQPVFREVHLLLITTGS